MTTVMSAIDKGFAVKPPFVIIEPKRVDYLPDTPSIVELVTMTPEKEVLFKGGMALSNVARVLSGPPDIAADKTKFLRDAFKSLAEMKAFQDQSKLYFPLWTKPMTGDEVLAFLKEAKTLPMDKVKAMVDKYIAIK